MKTIQPDSLLFEVQPKIIRGEFEFMRELVCKDTIGDMYYAFITSLQNSLADIPLEYGTVDKDGGFVPLNAPRLSKKNKDALQNLSDAIQTVLENGGQALAHLNQEFFRPEFDKAYQALLNSDGSDTEIDRRFHEAADRCGTKEEILPVLEKLQAASDMNGVKLPTRPPKSANEWYFVLMRDYTYHTLKWPTGHVSKSDPFSRLCRLVFPAFNDNQHKRFMKTLMDYVSVQKQTWPTAIEFVRGR